MKISTIPKTQVMSKLTRRELLKRSAWTAAGGLRATRIGQTRSQILTKPILGKGYTSPANEILEVIPPNNSTETSILFIPGRNPNKFRETNLSVQNAIQQEADLLATALPENTSLSVVQPAYLSLPKEEATNYTNMSSILRGIIPFIPPQTENPNEIAKIIAHIQSEIREGRKPTLVGHSFGGRLTYASILELFEKHNGNKDLFRKVILLAPALRDYELEDLQRYLGEKLIHIVNPNDSMQLFPATNILQFPGAEKEFKQSNNVGSEPHLLTNNVGSEPHLLTSYVNNPKLREALEN